MEATRKGNLFAWLYRRLFSDGQTYEGRMRWSLADSLKEGGVMTGDIKLEEKWTSMNL